MPDLDAALKLAFHAELDSLDFAVDPFPIVTGHRRRHRPRPQRWVVGATVVCLAAVATFVGLSSLGGQTRLFTRHVGAWTFTVADANAATSPTMIGRKAVLQDATAKYRALTPGLRTEGVYLPNDPEVVLAARAAKALSVRFPGGSSFDVPDGPADIWYLQLASRAHPSDPAFQIDMVISGDGRVLAAIPRERPGIVGAHLSPTPVELSNLTWTSVPVTIYTVSTACDGPACGDNPQPPPPPNPNAQLDMAVADMNGGTVIELQGTGMNPNTAFYLETGVGIIGSAQTDAQGTLVAVFTMTGDQVADAIAADGGIARLYGQGLEDYRACPLGGTLTETGGSLTCS